MKKSLAILCAVFSLTAFSGSVEAAPRADAALVIEIDHRGERGDYRRHDRGGRHDGALSERRIERMLMRRGFVEIEDIERRRDRYVVRAIRPNGALVRLAVDAYDGEIIARERIGFVRDRGPGRRGGGIELRIGNGGIEFYGR